MATATGAYATTALVKERLFAAGVTDTADDTLIGKLVDQVNQYIEGPEGATRVLAPISSATYLFDGDGTNRLYYPGGIRAVSVLEVADSTGGTFATLASTDYFLRPLPQYRDSPQHPATKLVLSDLSTYGFFRRGMANVRVTMTTGWAAIPEDIIDVALTTVVRAWGARQSGQQDITGTTDTGAPIVSRFMSARDRETLRAYRPFVSASFQ